MAKNERKICELPFGFSFPINSDQTDDREEDGGGGQPYRNILNILISKIKKK